jgi:hypothetical protein
LASSVQILEPYLATAFGISTFCRARDPVGGGAVCDGEYPRYLGGLIRSVKGCDTSDQLLSFVFRQLRALGGGRWCC